MRRCSPRWRAGRHVGWSARKAVSRPPWAMAGGGLVLRPLQRADYDRGYLDLLAQLTVVGSVSREAFEQRLGEVEKRGEDHRILVIEDTALDRIVATGTVLIEYKILRQCGKVGHVEDVVVAEDMRGRHLGQRILAALDEYAKDAGCYKVILDCNEANVPFYDKCGYKRKEFQMAKYF
eukprot:SM000068S20614  [mRNA]  locus=s68:591881:593238:+ [translate_table: standard]